MGPVGLALSWGTPSGSVLLSGWVAGSGAKSSGYMARAMVRAACEIGTMYSLGICATARRKRSCSVLVGPRAEARVVKTASFLAVAEYIFPLPVRSQTSSTLKTRQMSAMVRSLGLAFPLQIILTICWDMLIDWAMLV